MRNVSGVEKGQLHLFPYRKTQGEVYAHSSFAFVDHKWDPGVRT